MMMLTHGKQAIKGGSGYACRRNSAFTIIELLVVIGIIGILAAITMGVVGTASKANKRKAVEAQFQKLVTMIDNYKAAVGDYPRDNPNDPARNPLYYELSGTVYNPSGGGRYTTLNRRETLKLNDVTSFFGVDGFANAAQAPRDVPFQPSTDFKETEYRQLSSNPDIKLLVAPVPGRPADMLPGPGAGNMPLNPWRYDYSNPVNNPKSYDLWVDVVVGDVLYRYCNWSSEPLVLP